MNNRIIFFLALAALFAISSAPASAQPAQTDTLTIIHINDTHSNLMPFAGGKYGGIARAASVIEQWKGAEPNPLLLHSGDLMVGTLMFNTYYGIPELQILNSLGFDALCLGNHEFDFGPDQLGMVLQSANLDSSFKIISTNALNLAAVSSLDGIVKTEALKQKGNLTIGILGLTTPSANLESNPSPVFIDTALATTAMESVARLHAAGAQVVILMSHLGVSVDQQLAQYLTGVDAIIGGHTHVALPNVLYINNIPIVQAGDAYHYVGKLRLVHSANATSLLDYRLEEITDRTPADPAIEAMVASLEPGITAQFTPTLGDPFKRITTASKTFEFQPSDFHRLDTPLGNLVTDALLHSDPFADCALEATGDIASNLYAGPVTPAELFRLYPYGFDTRDALGFRSASYTLTGEQLWQAMEILAQFIDPATRSFDYVIQSSGLNYTLLKSSEGIHVGSISIHNRPLTFSASYRIVSSDRVPAFLANVLGITASNVVVSEKSVNQVFVEYASGFQVLRAPSRGTNVVHELAKGTTTMGHIATPHSFVLEQNYPNPFNPTTTIGYQLSADSKVTLRVYSTSGQLVATLIDGIQSAGAKTAVWNGSAVASGAYFYRLDAENLTAPFEHSFKVMRMTLAK